MDQPARGVGRRLRLARVARGLSQAELAASCGVSRQAVAGMEGDRWSPSLAVAIRLAAALQVTVEQLFEEPDAPRRVAATPLAPPRRKAARARMGDVFGRPVAMPLEGDRAGVPGFGPASGELSQAGSWYWLPDRSRSLLVAGCDPALPLLGACLPPGDPPWELAWWPCGSSSALQLLEAGLVHAAAVHHPSGERPLLGSSAGLAQIGFTVWREGIAVRPGGGLREPDLGQMVDRGWRLVNREPGAEARDLLDRELLLRGMAGDSVPGYGSRAAGHLAVASAVASGVADFGVASEPAALAFGLDFLALSQEECVILVARDRLDSAELVALLDSLGTARLARQLAALSGYDLEILGQEF